MTLIDSWDSGQPGALWDSGLQWDVNSGPSVGDVEVYARLITSEHNQQPNFMATVRFVLQPFADNIATLSALIPAFDLDTAVGAQLDVVGEWVGVSRELRTPIVGVYFSLDVAGQGFDEGTWLGPFDPTNYLVSLPDESYRLLLRAKIMNNRWNGTIPQAYEIWDELFAGTDYGILIQDLGDMHMLYALTGPTPDAITLALFLGGYLNNRPGGVKVDAYMTPTVSDTPYFGFDVDNASISGFDTGAWGAMNNA